MKCGRREINGDILVEEMVEGIHGVRARNTIRRLRRVPVLKEKIKAF